MKAKVLREFPYSLDGVSSTLLLPGADCDIRDDLAPGLEKEGYIAPAPADEPKDAENEAGEGGDPDPSTVEIPADWQELGWNQLRAIAAKLTAEPVVNKAAATAAIEAELARRAGHKA